MTNQIKSNIFSAGDEISLTGNHPWTGCRGEFITIQSTNIGPAYVVVLDNGIKCFVFDIKQIKKRDKNER